MNSQPLAIIIKTKPQTLLQFLFNSTSISDQFLLKINVFYFVGKLCDHLICLLTKVIFDCSNINYESHLFFHLIVSYLYEFFALTFFSFLKSHRHCTILAISKPIIGNFLQNPQLLKCL